MLTLEIFMLIKMTVLTVIFHVSLIIVASHLISQIKCWGNSDSKRQGGDLKWPPPSPQEWETQNPPDFERRPDEPDNYDWEISNRGVHGQGSGIFLVSDDIDLTRNDPNRCVEHPHKYPQNLRHYTYTKSPTINISVGEDSHKCIEVYDISGCKGMSLQFMNVTKKSLRLNKFGLTGPDQEKLMNFNLCPKSLKKCIPVEESETEELEKWKTNTCKVNFQIQIESNKPRIHGVSDACIDIDKPQPARKPQSYINRDLSLSILKKSKDMVCMDLYTKKSCNGEVIRVIIPPLTSSDPPNPPVLLWEYFSNSSGSNLIDTDVNSVRKCLPCVNPPHMPPKSGNKLQSSSDTTIASSQTSPSSTLISTTGSPQTSENLDGKSKDCHFLNCTGVTKFLSIENLSERVTQLNQGEGRCYFFVNNSKCSLRPIIADNKINVTIMEQVLGLYVKFTEWSIAECDDYEGVVPPDCLSPLTENYTLIDAYMLGSWADFIGGPEMKRNMRKSQNMPSKYAIADGIIYIGVTFTLITMGILVIMLVMLWRKKRRIRMIRARHGVSKHANTTSSSNTPQPQRHLNVHQIDQIDDNDYVNDITGLQALIKCFAKDKYELSRESINIGNVRDSTASIIGVGEFSIAFKGRLEPGGRTVAVKTMKSGQATARSMKGALKECQVFMMLGKHERIVEFIGVCTEGVRKGELLVVLEFCEMGPLKGFLVQQRSYFVSLLDEDEETLPDNETIANEALSPLQAGPPVRFNTFQLFKWCWEVADALEFLDTRKIVHVSLSARNVLLDSKYSSKICDFHLAKIPGENSASGYNRRTNTANKERHIPFRFFAVESLLDDIFSTQSDVWTFGVFMWEIFTMGSTPYPEYHHGPEFSLYLKHGYRLQKPGFAPIDCYELMLMCWYDAPEKRPTFTKIKSRLEEIMMLKTI